MEPVFVVILLALFEYSGFSDFTPSLGGPPAWACFFLLAAQSMRTHLVPMPPSVVQAR
jgi:hypothetical protein